MKNWNKILIAAIIIEIVILLLLIFFWREITLFPNSCYTSDFFHPFGKKNIQEGQMCLQVFTEGTNPLIYIISYTLILTVITYICYWIKNRKW